MKGSQDLLYDNSFTSSLYPSDHWGLTWDTKRENFIPEENTFDLKDLYTCGNYDNVLRSEYGGWLLEEEIRSHYQNEIRDSKEKQNPRWKYEHLLKRKYKRNYLIRKEEKN